MSHCGGPQRRCALHVFQKKSKRGGQARISPDTALRPGWFFGNEPQFWPSLPSACDLAVASRRDGERIARDVMPAA